uniref:Uncharacterized protein n=1 Tax=Chenopodium quinoa TaxID=63459 RepID=A0A803KMT7_CHEQI
MKFSDGFKFSSTKNSLFGYGCDTSVGFVGNDEMNATAKLRSGCATMCDRRQAMYFRRVGKQSKNNRCSGLGCCTASVPDGMNLNYIVVEKHTYALDFNPCSVAFAVATDAMPTIKPQFLSENVDYFKKLQLPMVYDWSIIGVGDCETARSSKAGKDFICKGNSECLNVTRGYRCQCNPGFEGNPYLHDCHDIDECSNQLYNPCKHPAECINTNGSYVCLCPKGYSDISADAKNTLCSPSTNQSQYKLAVGLSVTLGSILLFILGYWIYKLIKRRQKEQNSSLLLSYKKPLITLVRIESLDKEAVGRSIRELAEGKIVAVKKPKKLEESEIMELINEIAILSQINHRNIVKLLGCCLETEVPLLVSEFIPNGTLFHHIHYPSEEFPITWKMRLQIASDSAGALAYLHCSSSIPIFHRDIKSSNILLDEKYRGKLSDFGTSRLVGTDQTHVTTRVMGTRGYFDPEYIQTHQFTEKSDVYSFGVVLVELLTGQKAIRAISEQDRSLTAWFLSHMENSRLLDIIDSQVLKENCNKEEFHTIATLAKRCLSSDGKRRPSIKEVSLEIEAVLSLHLPQINEPGTPTEPDEVFVTEAFKGSFNDCGSSSSTFNLESKP